MTILLSHNFDIIIIGSGIIGCSIGLELLRKGFKTCNIDMYSKPGKGSTSYSSGIIRTFYSALDSVKVSSEGLFFWKNLDDYLKQSNSVKFRQIPSIILENDSSKNFIKKVLLSYDLLNIFYERIDQKILKKNYPWMNLDSYGQPKLITDRTFGKIEGKINSAIRIPDSGYISDPQMATTNVQEACKREGGTFLFNQKVVEILKKTGKITGIRLENNIFVSSPVIVNCAGPHSNKITKMAFQDHENDMSINTRPLREEVAYLPWPTNVKYSNEGIMCPDFENGIYFRSEIGNKLISGSTEPTCDNLKWCNNYDNLNTNLGQDYDNSIYRLSLRIKNLPIPNQASGIVACYDVTPDWCPIYDKSNIPGYYMAIGTSGNQFKNAPVIGYLMTELIIRNESSNFQSNDFFQMRHSHFYINMKKFSRLRTITPDSAINVLA